MAYRKQAKAVIESGPDIQEAWVDSPQTAWSQYLYELDSGLPQAGRQKAMVDRRSIMGGFCRFHGTQAQEEAAARFRTIYERSQVGGAKAVDPSREAVDGGGINPDSVIEIGADARAKYTMLVKELGVQTMRKIEFVVIGDKGPTAYARWRYRMAQPDGRTVGQGSVEVRGLLEQVAVLLKLQNRRTA